VPLVEPKMRRARQSLQAKPPHSPFA